jgi:hypothetical protein
VSCPREPNIQNGIPVYADNPWLDEQVAIELSPMLRSDGSRRWAVRQVKDGNTSMSRNFGDVLRVEGDPARDVAVTFTGLEAGTLRLEGTVKARPCPAVPRERQATERPQAGLEVEVAGFQPKIRGAVLRRSPKGDRLTLSSQADDCTLPPTADLRLEVTLAGEKAPRLSEVSGRLVPSYRICQADERVTRVDAKADPAKDGQVVVHLDLDLVECGYPIKVKGDAAALVCAD